MLTETEPQDSGSLQEQGVFRHEVFIAARIWEMMQRNMFHANTGNWGVDTIKDNSLRRFHHALKVREMLRRTGLGVFMEYEEVFDNNHSAYLIVDKEGFSLARTERIFGKDGKGLIETGVNILIDVHPGAPLYTFMHQ